MKLWIDDVRKPPPGWTWAKNSQSAIDVLSINQIDEISFDHDLGGDDTTRPVVIFLCETNYWPNVCYVHSANPVGIDWLTGMINRYAPNRVKYW